MKNDAYKDIKAKYLESAQKMTGTVAGVVKSMNNYVHEYDVAKMVMNDAIADLKKNYTLNSPLYESRRSEIMKEFTETVEAIKQKYVPEIQGIATQVRGRVTDVISASLPDGAMDDLTMIRNFAGNLSDDEVKVFLSKYEKNYLVRKAIFDAIGSERTEGLGLSFVSSDDVISNIDSIESTALNFIGNYNGSLEYKGVTLLHGDGIQDIDKSLEVFASAYEG